MKERLEFIDLAKGFGIYLVILGHCYSKANDLGMLISAYHMPLFFIISGFLQHLSTKNFSASLKANVKSLLIPYFVFSIAFALYLAIMNYDNGFIHVFTENFRHVVTLCGLSVDWFLPTLLLAEIVIIVAKNIDRSLVKYLMFALPVMLLLKHYGLEQLLLKRVLTAIFYLSAGFCIGEWGILEKLKKTGGVTGLIFLVVFISSSYANGSAGFGGMRNPLLYILSSFSGTFLHIMLCRKIIEKFDADRVVKKFLELGRYSIIVLCTHMFIIEIIRLIDYKIFGDLLKKLSFAEGIVFSLIVLLIEFIIVKFFDTHKKFLILFGR